MISIIIPYRKRLKNLISLAQCISLDNLCNVFEVILIAHGDTSNKVKDICAMNGFRYIQISDKEKPFSYGECMNTGVREASFDYIFKFDVDCVFYKGFINQVLHYVKYGEAPFYLLSVVYCSERFTINHLNIHPIEPHLLAKAMEKENNINFHYGRPSGTMFLMRKSDFKKIGGISEKFIGHGYEDFYLLANLIHMHFPEYKPKKLSIHLLRRLTLFFNRPTNAAGLIFFHQYHDRDFKSEYYSFSGKNEQHLLEHLNDLFF